MNCSSDKVRQAADVIKCEVGLNLGRGTSSSFHDVRMVSIRFLLAAISLLLNLLTMSAAAPFCYGTGDTNTKRPHYQTGPLYVTCTSSNCVWAGLPASAGKSESLLSSMQS